MEDDTDTRIVLPYSSLVLKDETATSSLDSQEQDDDGEDTNLIIDESSSTSSQYPVDLSVRHTPVVSSHSWFHSGVTSSGDVSIARKPETGFQVPNSLLSILQQPAKSSGLFVSSSSSAVSPPKLVPLTHPLTVSSQYSASNLPDIVQITSDSEGVQPQGSDFQHQGRKIRKRVLSECMRELNTVQTRHERLKAVHDRLEYRVNRIKAEYMHIIKTQTHDCSKLKLCQYLTEESGRIKEEPSE